MNDTIISTISQRRNGHHDARLTLRILSLAREMLGTANKPSPRLRLPQLEVCTSIDFVIQRFHCVSISLDCYDTPQKFFRNFAP